MAVLTLFFCGTGFNSFDFHRKTYPEGELIATLARNMAGVENVDWVLVDGVGSGNFQKKQMFVASKSHGTLQDQAFGLGVQSNAAHAVAMVRGQVQWSPTPKPLREAQLHPRLIRKRNFIAEQDARQQRWEQTAPHEDAPGPHRLVRKNAMKKNVLRPTWLNQPAEPRILFQPTAQELIAHRQYLARRHHPVTSINVVGWSRGAVTAHAFANKLHEDSELCHLPLNIIAVDPVSGPINNWNPGTIRLPSNVKRYVCFYARDEHQSWKLTPMKAQLGGHVDATFYVVPGGHSTIVGKPDVGGEYPLRDTRRADWHHASHAYRLAPARLVRRLTERYLVDWGTVLLTRLPGDDRDLLLDYDLMVQSHEKFRHKPMFGSPDFVKRKIKVAGSPDRTTLLSAAMRREIDAIFINTHHRQLFEKFHPVGSWSSLNDDTVAAGNTWHRIKACATEGA